MKIENPCSFFFISYYTPGKNKLLWNFNARANADLHENQGVKSFSQLQDERKIPSSKRGPSYTGPAKCPGFHEGVRLRKRENFIIIYFYREC